MKPGPVFLVSGALWAILGGVVFLHPQAQAAWIYAGLALGLAAVTDAGFLRFLTASIHVNRRIPAALALGEPVLVRLEIRAGDRGFAPWGLKVFDRTPDAFRYYGLPLRVSGAELSARENVEVAYTLRPLERGDWRIDGVDIRVPSFLGFWRLERRIDESSSGKTYPNFRGLLRLAAAEIRGVTDAVGVKSIRRRGLGTEFLSLREYRPGDSVRTLDWKATSRYRRPIVREYQDEMDQGIVFLIDTGYRLHRRDGDFLLFDRALDALLLLSYVALKHQDAVSVLSFGPDERWMPPVRGVRSMPELLNALYDLKSGPGASSPAAGLESVLARVRRRCLILLLSNLQEEDGESLSRVLPLAAGRHLVLSVNIREEGFLTSSRIPIVDMDAALERSAAFLHARERRILGRRWEGMGILNMESRASGVSPALVNAYLDLKRSGRF